MESERVRIDQTLGQIDIRKYQYLEKRGWHRLWGGKLMYSNYHIIFI